MARSTRRVERGDVDPPHRRAVGRSSTAISAVSDVPPSLSEVGTGRRLGQAASRAGRAPARSGQGGLNRSVHRRLPRGGKKGGAHVGKTRRGKATKIMAVADRNGLPIAIGIASGERHETKLVFETLWKRFVAPLPERLIGDKAYDSAPLERNLKLFDVELIVPHRATRKNRTQDGRKLRRYKRRWHVERLFAWLQTFRRLVTRFENKACNFLAFLKLACVIILLRRL